MTQQNLLIQEEDTGKRLDAVLARYLPDISRTRWQSLIAEGCVLYAGSPLLNGKTRLQPGMELLVRLPDVTDNTPQAEEMPLHIVHEDEALLVIEKPAGLVVHPAAGNLRHTLVNGLLHHCGSHLADTGDPLRPGIVHRLDKDTSGLLVVAKTEKTYRHLARQFADHGRNGALKRSYETFIWGVPSRSSGTIDAPLARSPINREKIAVSEAENARFAITHYHILEVYPDSKGNAAASRILCTLETGRTHQIRVHMAHIGHPVIADPLYATGFKTKTNRLGEKAAHLIDNLQRQALHAGLLGFEHPETGQAMLFESPLPEDLSYLHTLLKEGI